MTTVQIRIRPHRGKDSWRNEQKPPDDLPEDVPTGNPEAGEDDPAEDHEAPEDD